MKRAVVMLLVAGACRFGFDPSDAGDDGSNSADGPTDPYARAVLADGPIAYFRFDEAAGAAVATSVVGGVTGTYKGAFVFGVDGAIAVNPCVTFDGRTTRVEVGDGFRFGGVAGYTFEIWIRAADIVDTRFVIDRQSASSPSDGYTLYLGQTYLLFARRASGTEFGYVNTGSGPPLNTWIYAVVTFDGTTQRLYVDGTLAQSNGAATPIADTAGSFVIGDNVPGQYNKYAGDLDELAIYDRPLSQTQIDAHLAAARP